MIRYEALICDLDGVVYRGRQAVDGAVRALATLMGEGTRIAFATNNASREPAEVRAHLRELGISAPARAPRSIMSVVTSAEAAAHLVRTLIGAGEPVLAVGGPGVATALREARLRPFTAADSRSFPVASAVVQGAASTVSWTDLAEAAFRVQQGALWVATNGDRTIPTGRGLAPGNGALVDVVRAAVEIDPLIAGKPEPALYELALERLGGGRGNTLVVGDRLDTDVAGAVRLGLDSMLVLGGAHGLAEVVHCEPALRPTCAGVDLRALLVLGRGDDLEAPIEPIVVEHGVVRVPRIDPPDPSHLLDRVVRGAWAVLDGGGELPRRPDAWRDLELHLAGTWNTWWRGSPRDRNPGAVLNDPKSVP